MSEDVHVGQVAIIKDNKVLVVMRLNDVLYNALTSGAIIADLGDNLDNIDSTYSYNPNTRSFFKE
jgi:hypothetical protein